MVGYTSSWSGVYLIKDRENCTFYWLKLGVSLVCMMSRTLAGRPRSWSLIPWHAKKYFLFYSLQTVSGSQPPFQW
jgi:hypothetical protein